MDAPPPLPPQAPPSQLPPARGMGCFAAGCLIVLAIIAFVAVVGGIGAWFFYGKAVATFTSPRGADVRIENVSDADLQSAEAKLNQLGQATTSNQEIAVEFTAAELNAMIAREPLFADLNNRVRVAIADSLMTVQMSVPLDTIPLPRLKGHWFNGTARFAFSFGSDAFIFDLKSGEANGNALPQEFFLGIAPSVNRLINDDFKRDIEKNDQATNFWRHIKTITLSGDKLVVTTQRL